MNIVWTYLVTGLLMVAAASLVIGGETASAELRIVEAATRALSDASPAAAGDGALAKTPETAEASRK